MICSIPLAIEFRI